MLTYYIISTTIAIIYSILVIRNLKGSLVKTSLYFYLCLVVIMMCPVIRVLPLAYLIGIFFMD